MKIFIPGRGVGKGRPRISINRRTGHVVRHTCPRYGAWKDAAIAHIKTLKLGKVPSPFTINCTFINFFSSDADNLIGSVADALVEAEVLDNDSSSNMTGCSGRFVKVKKERNKDKIVGILVEISPSKIETVELELI